jgi:hypothetical protein
MPTFDSRDPIDARGALAADEVYYVADTDEDAEAIWSQLGQPVKVRRVVREEVLYAPAAAAANVQTFRASRRPSVRNVQTSGL